MLGHGNIIAGILIALFVITPVYAQTGIIQSNIGSGCSSICINGKCETSCGDSDSGILRGDGIPSHKSYPFKGFTSVIAENIQTRISWGEEYSVSVTADSNLLDKVELRERPDGLYVTLVAGMYQDTSIKVGITMPTIDSLQQTGSSDVSLSGFNQDSFQLLSEGSGSVVGQKNRFGRVKLVSRGVGLVDLQQSSINNVRIDVTGSSEIRLSLTGSDALLLGKIEGVGELFYCGNPELRVRVSGIAEVRQLDCTG